jgi:thiol-disulfide isomerase/thioredoxin
MKTLSLILLAAAFAGAQEKPRIAPPLTIHMNDGSDTLLSKYKGKVVLLALMNTTCTHCQDFSKTTLSPLAKEYGPKGVQVVGVVFDKEAKPRLPDFLRQFVQGFPVGYTDPDTALKFVTPTDDLFIPIVYFINRQGVVENRYFGDDPFLADGVLPKIRKKLDGMLAAPAGAR